MNRPLRLALPKGNFSEQTIKALIKIGYRIAFKENSLVCQVLNFPMNIYLIRQNDALKLLNDNYCDLVIIGSDYISEHAPHLHHDFNKIFYLNYCQHRISIAVPSSMNFKSILDLEGKTIATSTPNILTKFLKQSNVQSSIYVLGGSVELTPEMGIADAICDIIDTGRTINAHGITEVIEVQKIQPVLVQKSVPISSYQQALFREFIDSLLQTRL